LLIDVLLLGPGNQYFDSFTTAAHLRELEETTRTPSYYMDEDYPEGPEIQWPLLEWSNWHGSE